MRRSMQADLAITWVETDQLAAAWGDELFDSGRLEQPATAMMQQRRSHKKSRRGCLNCKKWHTKCDESGPPCKNCTLRNAKCEYAWARDDKGTALAQSRKSSSSTSSSGERGLSESGGLVVKECRRMLELELMHYWSTTTYKSLCSVPEDHHYMQFIMPQEAMRYDFLLNGIFVAAALHRSTMAPEPEARGYFNVAMELYDRASRSFRTHLGKMNPATHHMLYIYSSMTALINIAFSQCNFSEGSELNTLSTMAVAFDLMNGSGVSSATQSSKACLGVVLLTLKIQVSIAQTDFQRLLDSPIPLRAYLQYGFASNITLHPDTMTALSRLENLNGLYHGYQEITPTPSDELSVATTPLSDTVSTISTTPKKPWKTAIALLRLSFAEEQRAVLRGFSFIFPGGAGPDFVRKLTRYIYISQTAAIKACDPMALLILMHWTVLVHRAGDEYWWVNELGKRLAIGIWKAMQLAKPRSPSPALLAPEWGESISWVCAQLGLPEFVQVPR
ncbi:hypothetical protein NUW58_g3873 [Xylaria curta]|uniref:Uncharacterized protein n=1 Tax=Xylaria curta TaxID=42375 RepID=A0ACC1PBI1_9PEZI|nr:hypothetical protein NUW58_g3873 [Xylaria curta]